MFPRAFFFTSDVAYPPDVPRPIPARTNRVPLAVIPAEPPPEISSALLPWRRPSSPPSSPPPWCRREEAVRGAAGRPSSSLGRGWVCRSAQRAGASACATCRGASPPSGTLDTAASTPPPLSCMRCVGRRRCDGTAGHKRRTG
ncbi:hypothetical protein PVAP13_5NG340600 [Panicum virgatum]|uniref:Uncharacterized protein n=1 Tax=Panicum virgatum TaxID=38727 RepID=A0A8T0RQ71_PANVG|nr:hypothetical protein PVAP13_5NG340600 [Panicum virgatum]